jgi:hypothetical protein
MMQNKDPELFLLKLILGRMKETKDGKVVE